MQNETRQSLLPQASKSNKTAKDIPNLLYPRFTSTTGKMPLSTFLLLSMFLPVSLSDQSQPFVLPSYSTTIPAFPEQSDVATTCPLHLPPELSPAVSRACSSPSPDPSFRLRCCPLLAAWLFSAYAPAALSLRSSPANLPLLPDDSESCIDSIENSLRSSGVPLAPLNDTCDVGYCFCGIRLRPLSCPRGFEIGLEDGHWIARDDNARAILRDCGRPGLPGCSRCLRNLHRMKTTAANATADREKSRAAGETQRDCELMGLTWLLAANRTRYLSTVTKVLRALMMSPDGKDPATCATPKGMPMAVDSAELDVSGASWAVTRRVASSDLGRWIAGLLLVLVA